MKTSEPQPCRCQRLARAPHFDLTSFRVNKKIFCTIHSKTERVVVKLDPENLHNLAADDPAFEPDSGGWTYGVWRPKDCRV